MKELGFNWNKSKVLDENEQYINLWGKMKVTHEFFEAYSFQPAQTIKWLLHCILNILHVNLCFIIIIIIILISNERFDLKFVERGKNL